MPFKSQDARRRGSIVAGHGRAKSAQRRVAAVAVALARRYERPECPRGGAGRRTSRRVAGNTERSTARIRRNCYLLATPGGNRSSRFGRKTPVRRGAWTPPFGSSTLRGSGSTGRMWQVRSTSAQSMVRRSQWIGARKGTRPQVRSSIGSCPSCPASLGKGV